jgi:hypothetical protein
MDIARPIVIAPDVSSALAVISPSNVQEKKSENAKCVLCDGNHPANYKDAPSIKTYKREPSKPLRHKQDEKHQKVLSDTQIKQDISYVTILKPQQNQYETATPKPHHQTPYQQQPQLPTSDTHELKFMLKGLMV